MVESQIRDLPSARVERVREEKGESPPAMPGEERSTRVVRVAPEAAMLPVRDQYHFATQGISLPLPTNRWDEVEGGCTLVRGGPGADF